MNAIEMVVYLSNFMNDLDDYTESYFEEIVLMLINQDSQIKFLKSDNNKHVNNAINHDEEIDRLNLRIKYLVKAGAA